METIMKRVSFPKITKQIKDFVTNESGNLSTKSALIVWVAWVVTLWSSEALWFCEISPSGHFGWNTNGHYNGTGTFWAAVSNVPTDICSGQDVSYNYNSGCSTLTCNPISWVVNWHYNITPTCSSSVLSAHCNHVSSGSWSGWDWGGDSCG